MTESIEVRESMPGDLAAIELLYPETFPDEDLLALVRDLLREAPAALSLVGIIDSRLVGHVIFTKCGVVGSSGKAALLGPLAVAPAWQKQRIGSAIVLAGQPAGGWLGRIRLAEARRRLAVPQDQLRRVGRRPTLTGGSRDL